METRILPASAVGLVKDINDVPNNFIPQNVISVGNTTFFTAQTADLGVELWKTDGTTAGTGLVKDILPGPHSSAPQSLTNVGGMLYFSAMTTDLGTELWMSDGTADGTKLVANINPGDRSSNPRNLVNLNGALVFAADDGFTGQELWTTDGTIRGTRRMADIRGNGGSNPDLLTVVGNNLYFIANDGSTGTELWRTDGTSGETRQVRDIRPGTAGSAPSSLTNLSGKLLFVANDGSSGAHIWTTNGTDAGTVPVTGTQTGLNNPNPLQLTVVDDILYFTADTNATGRELWKTNGTPIGTQLVRDIRQGGSSSDPLSLVSVGGQLYFTADEGLSGRELWTSDGSTLGTVLVADLKANGSANPTLLTDVDGTLFFTADDGNQGRASELWKVSGQGETPQLVKVFAGTRTTSLQSFAAINGDLFFSFQYNLTSTTTAMEFWKSDGTETGTVKVKSSTLDSNPGALIRGGINVSYNPEFSYVDVNGTLFFAANDGLSGEELWKSDGTAAGTVLVRDINQGSTGSGLTDFTRVGGKLYFSAYGNSGARGLWVSDGTTAGTQRIEVPLDRELSDPRDLVSFRGKLFFTATGRSDEGRELWQSDGTREGTFVVKDIAAGSDSSNVQSLTVVGDRLYFSADNRRDGQLLWKSDGTSDGTSIVSSRSGQPKLLTAAGNRLFFLSQRMLYVTDGTDAGTAKLTDGEVAEVPMAYMNGILYFHGSNDLGFELWRSDGRIAGTYLLKEINTHNEPGAAHSNISELTVIGQTLYFSAFTPGEGSELWKSDGTTSGTGRVLDIRPGTEGSYPEQFRNAGGILYFVANDGIHGYELWRSDGTEVGTRLVSDLLPGVGSTDIRVYPYQVPRLMTGNGDTLYFSGNDGVTGHELYRFSPNSVVTPQLTLSSPRIAENNAANAPVGMLGVSDPSSSATFALVPGAGDADNGSFSIVGNVLTIKPVTDFETKRSYLIRVRATDQAGHTNEQALTIKVTNLNDAPTLDPSGNPFAILGAGSRQSAEMRQGVLVSDILARGAGGKPIRDPDAGARRGIALTAVDQTLGNFQFTLVTSNPQESDWVNVDAAGAISNTSALLLPTTARLRFTTGRIPHHASADFFLSVESKLDAGLTFRAWDRTTGTAGGRADTSTYGGTSAFSAASETSKVYFEVRLFRSFNPNASLNVYTLEAEFNALTGGAFQDRSTDAFTGFTVLLSDVPELGTSALFRLYFGIQFNDDGTETDMGYRYLTSNGAEAAFLESIGPTSKQPQREGTYFRELGVSNGTATIGYVFTTQQPGTSELTQIYRTDVVNKQTRPPGTSEGGTPTSFKPQENGDHVYTTNTAFESTKVGTWRIESTRGFVRPLGGSGIIAPATSSPIVRAAATINDGPTVPLFNAGVTGSLVTPILPPFLAATSSALNPEQVSTTVDVGLIAPSIPATQPVVANDGGTVEATDPIPVVTSELVEQTSATDDLFTILGNTAHDLCPW
jgi:ELWxxDGT repeat protein